MAGLKGLVERLSVCCGGWSRTAWVALGKLQIAWALEPPELLGLVDDGVVAGDRSATRTWQGELLAEGLCVESTTDSKGSRHNS